MLYNLTRRNKKSKTILKSIAGSSKSLPFDPLTLPSYEAGYYMNLITDIPIGSIEPPVSIVWWDMKNISLPAHKLEGLNVLGTTIVNGFKANNLYSTTSYFRNTQKDNLSGVTDFCFVIGFKRNTATATNRFIFNCQNGLSTIRGYIYLSTTGTLTLKLNNYVVSADAVSSFTYDDNVYHCCIGVFNQTTKTVTLFTDKGEHVIGVQPLLGVPVPFTQTNINDFCLGANSGTSLQLFPGVLGDCLFFNTVPSLGLVNNLMKWEADRLGISYVVF